MNAWPSVLLGAALGLAVGCSVSLADPAGRACDATHPCAGGRVCSADLLCVADAGGPTPAASSSASANINPYGTFESGCDSWVAPADVTVTASSVAHGGNEACQFCGGAPDLSLDDKGFFPNPPPATYRASAWLRVADGHPTTVLGLILRTVDHPNGTSFEEVEKAATNPPYAGGGWQELTVDLHVTKPAEVLNVVVYGHSGTCLLVDDVTVERLP